MAIAQRTFAFIDNAIVKNIIVCDNYQTADSLAKNVIGLKAFAVEVTQIQTTIGDGYFDGFFRNSDGEIIHSLPTAEQEVVALKTENEALKASQASQDELIMSLMLGGA